MTHPEELPCERCGSKPRRGNSNCASGAWRRRYGTPHSEDHSHSAAKAPSKSARPRSQTWRCFAQRIAWFAMVVAALVVIMTIFFGDAATVFGQRISAGKKYLIAARRSPLRIRRLSSLGILGIAEVVAGIRDADGRHEMSDWVPPENRFTALQENHREISAMASGCVRYRIKGKIEMRNAETINEIDCLTRLAGA